MWDYDIKCNIIDCELNLKQCGYLQFALWLIFFRKSRQMIHIRSATTNTIIMYEGNVSNENYNALTFGVLYIPLETQPIKLFWISLCLCTAHWHNRCFQSSLLNQRLIIYNSITYTYIKSLYTFRYTLLSSINFSLSHHTLSTGKLAHSLWKIFYFIYSNYN